MPFHQKYLAMDKKIKKIKIHLGSLKCRYYGSSLGPKIPHDGATSIKFFLLDMAVDQAKKKQKKKEQIDGRGFQRNKE